MKSSKRVSPPAATPVEGPLGSGPSVVEPETASNPSPIAPSPSEVAAYIAEMSAGLAALARSSELKVLAYLLEVAKAEAVSHASRKNAIDS